MATTVLPTVPVAHPQLREGFVGRVHAARAQGVAGTDAAIEAAHVARMRDDWDMVPEAIALGRRAFRVIAQNLWFTAGYNAVGNLPAATGWLPRWRRRPRSPPPYVAVMLNSTRSCRSRPVMGTRRAAPEVVAPHMGWRLDPTERR